MSINTPWGRSQYQQKIVDGITIYSTAGHGGIKLCDGRNAQVHEAWRNDSGWYEEDCEANIVGVTFPAEFAVHGYTADVAHASAKNWYPDQYEQVYDVTLTGADSFIRAEQEFHAKHADDFVVTAAWGDWQEGVPAGMVGVVAQLGGRPNGNGERAYFLVPQAEYDKRERHGFVVDLVRHQRVADFTGDGRTTKAV